MAMKAEAEQGREEGMYGGWCSQLTELEKEDRPTLEEGIGVGSAVLAHARGWWWWLCG